VALAAGAIDVVCVTLAAWLAVRTAARIFGAGSQVGVAVVLLSALALTMDVCLMETALVLLASAAVLDLLCRSEIVASRSTMALAIGLGLGGMLARSDFGLLTVCLFAAQLVMWRRGLSSRAMVRLAGAVVAGSLLGLAVVLLHTHWISGEWLQSSAQQKLLWSRLQGFSTAPIRALLWRFFLLHENSGVTSRRVVWPSEVGSLGLVVALAAGLAMALRPGEATERQVAWRRTLTAGLCSTIAAYVFFYRFNSADMQSWYVANVEMPMAVLAGGGASWLAGRQRTVSIAVAGAVCAGGIALSFVAPLPYQAPMYEAGVYLGAHPELKPVGAWNAGIIGYFGGGGVTNLDGLVNDRILPYSAAGSLGDYVRQRRLRTLIDFGMWLSPGLAERAGDSRGELRKCVDAQPMRLANGEVDPGSPMSIFVVRPDCDAAQVK
jgi:hypothetical protein